MKETGYKPGEWKAVCDICGFDFFPSELREDWRGYRVCKKDFEPRHPQDFVRPKPEKGPPSWTRPAEIITADYTASADLQNETKRLLTVDATSGNITLTLPGVFDASFNTWEHSPYLKIARIDNSANTLTIAKPSGGGTLTTVAGNQTAILRFVNTAAGFEVWGKI